MVHYPPFSSPCASVLWVSERGGKVSPTWSNCVARQPTIWSAQHDHCLTIAWGIPMPQVMDNCFSLRLEIVLVN